MLRLFPTKNHVLFNIEIKEFTNKIITYGHFEKKGNSQFDGQSALKLINIFYTKFIGKMLECKNGFWGRKWSSLR